MADVTALVQILHRVAEQTLNYSYKCWGFGEAIAMRGLLAASCVTGEARYRKEVMALFNRWREARRGELSFGDHVTPGLSLLLLIREDATWLSEALGLGRLFCNMPLVDGISVHRPDLADWSTYVWVDCLYNDFPFLAGLAVVTGDDSWMELAIAQAMMYVQALLDERTGLFFHGYDCRTGRTNGIRWGRGNGWALLGLIELLRFLPRDHAGREYLGSVIRRQINSLVMLQDPAGHWHTVLDHPDTYLETSIAAMMAWAMPQAVMLGVITGADANHVLDAAERAFDAALAAVDAQGGLTGVSEATPVGDLDAYTTRRTGVFPWGQGSILLAIADRISPDCIWEGSL